MIGLGIAQGWTADLSRVATGGLMAAVWQGILLAGAVWIGLRLLPKTPAAVRFAIWFGVFLVVTGLPVFSLWPHAAVATQIGGRSAWLTLDARWSLAIAAVWAVASVIRAGTLVMAAVRVRTLWRRAKPVGQETSAGPSTARVAGATCSAQDDRLLRAGSRQAEICTSDEVDRPTVIGFFSPKILIPAWLLEKLTATELEQIVLHETGHLGRADDWLNLVQKIALVVFPLNPALAWVERRLCFERELACDERVLQTTHAPKAYAACLAALAEHRLGRRGLALALGALGRESELGQRVGRILRRGETMRPLHARLVLGGAMLGLLGGAVGLERCPQVIGFAAAGEQIAAVGTLGEGSNGLRSGYGYRATEFHAGSLQSAMPYSNLGDGVNVAHETVLRAAITSGNGANKTGPQRLKPRVEGDVYGAAEAVPLSKTDVADISRTGVVETKARLVEGRSAATVRKTDVAGTRSTVGQDRRARQTGDGAVEWVVMTSWQGADGSQMVLTMASSSNVKDRVVRQSMVSDTEPSATQVYPYAAVPVRGGWLVFQL